VLHVHRRRQGRCAMTPAQQRILVQFLRAGTRSYGGDTWFKPKHVRSVRALERLGYVTAEYFPARSGRGWLTWQGRLAAEAMSRTGTGVL